MSSYTFPDSVILNVDDSDGARYAKSRILSRAGFTVIEAASGGEALRRARETHPNLILLDVKLETSADIIGSRRHTLSVELPAQQVWLQGDHVRLSQIVGNLLHNAAKFTPPGGAIGLAVQVLGTEVLIRVSDNGVGIAPASMDFIFGLFAQDRHAKDRVQDGLGIGLSLVRKLVTLHKGSVSASSAGPGRGSVFEVRLPVPAFASRPEPAPAPAPAPQRGATLATRILVVDDNEDAADTLAELLGIDGHDVQTAYSGAQAIECARNFEPGVVFLDIGLPDLSGYEVAVKLREIPAMRRATLIALTGYGRD